MRRRRPDEAVERLRRKRVAPEAEALRSRLVELFNDDLITALANLDPRPSRSLHL